MKGAGQFNHLEMITDQMWDMFEMMRKKIMSQKKRHLVTAALIYANGPIHIGHLAGCYIPSDLYVRFLRSKGEDVKFISGTDEHGVPITIKARDENLLKK